MKILFITPQIPYPPHSGGRIVTWNTIRRFAEPCRVSVVSLYHHPDEIETLRVMKQHCEQVAAFPAYGKWSLYPLLRSLSSTLPYKAHRFYNPQMAGYLQRLMKREAFDIVHAQNFYTTRYVDPSWDVCKIHYKENIEGNILLRYAKAQSNPLAACALWLEGLRTCRFELRACHKFDRVLSISPLDRDTLNRWDSSLNAMHQRPGVDTHAYPFLDEIPGNPVIVFTGTLSYYPNSDGVLYFLQHGWIKVRQSFPSAFFYIVGSHPPAAIQRYHGENGVYVTGRVEDIQPYIEKAHVYIVPLRVGGGIRLKILEAMANGRAVVTSPVGCEGLDGVHQEHWLMGELPDAFTDHVIRLLRQADERSRLRQNARRLIETRYDWDHVIHSQIKQYRTWLNEYRRLNRSGEHLR